MRLPGLLDSGRSGGEVSARFATSFSRRLSQSRFHQALAFEPLQRGVDAGEGDVPTAFLGKVPRDDGRRRRRVPSS